MVTLLTVELEEDSKKKKDEDVQKKNNFNPKTEARGNRSRDKFQRERVIVVCYGRAGRDAFGRDLDRRHDPGRRRSPDRFEATYILNITLC